MDYKDLPPLDSSCFNSSYKTLVEIIGQENTIKLYEAYGGQYLPLPKKLLTNEYIHQLILIEYNGKNAIELAKKYGYTYSWIRKILKKKFLQYTEEPINNQENEAEDK